MNSVAFIQSLEQRISKLDSPLHLVYGAILVLLIVYSSVIPNDFKVFADSTLGRIFGVAIVYGVTKTVGWMYGLLTALAFLLMVHGVTRVQEGFDGGGGVTEKKTMNNRWFVEKVLGEDPQKIATDRVTTYPINGE